MTQFATVACEGAGCSASVQVIAGFPDNTAPGWVLVQLEEGEGKTVERDFCPDCSRQILPALDTIGASS